MGDSLGMPRQGVPFCETWYYRIIKHKTNYCFVNNFRRALTTNELSAEDFLENYSPQIVILQVGIVDCAPRYYKNNSLLVKLINVGPDFIRNKFWKLTKRFKSRISENADVSVDQFKSNLDSYIKRCERELMEKLIIIKIPAPSEALLQKNPKIRESIEAYNEVINSIKFNGQFMVIDPLRDGSNDDYIEDGYHLSKLGSQKIFNCLAPLL
ncbi:MAG: SGNH/GDSL hydrolase family protein [Cyclobacteriaceae bacterium]|nr:SGNH/GDSL hydrolase family protein [Cyclobacteriaceae bacterium]